MNFIKYQNEKFLSRAKKPVVVLGSGVFERKDGAALLSLANRLSDKLRAQAGGDWRVFNVLQRVIYNQTFFIKLIKFD